MKVAVLLTLSVLSANTWAQQVGLLRCEDGKGGVQYVEKFCPDGYKGVKDIRSRTKTEAEMEADLSKPGAKKTLTEGQARRCVSRKSEVEAMKKRLTAMEGGPKYDAFAKRVETTEQQYLTECKVSR
jgi:hypothetical protein